MNDLIMTKTLNGTPVGIAGFASKWTSGSVLFFVVVRPGTAGAYATTVASVDLRKPKEKVPSELETVEFGEQAARKAEAADGGAEGIQREAEVAQ